uniref:Putative endonuclease/reverse transcript n=1 Tax=Ixodes ricinus TaxID=34613 RepID=A0A6B0V3W3_IXORI
MRISRTSPNMPFYHLTNVPLAPVSSYKYLGVHITCNLSWKLHVEYVINNANRMLGYLKRNFSLAPSALKLTLYKSLVRSKLEYASSIWDPSQSNLINVLEAVQNRSARFILGNYHRTASVSSMKITLSLPNLSLRRKVARLCLFHKIYHANSYLKQRLFIPPFYISRRIDHHLKVGISKCNANAFLLSFVPKTSLEWNHLSASVIYIIDTQMFKNAINTLYCPEPP